MFRFSPPKQMIGVFSGKPKKFAVTCHANPDGDAVGAVIGLTLALRQIGHDVAPVLPDHQNIWQWSPPWFRPEGMTTDIPADMESRVLVMLDCAAKESLGPDYKQLFERADSVVVIDHHIAKDPLGVISAHWIVPSASSASELVWWAVKQLNIPRRQLYRIALPLYAGAHSDTGGFTFESVNSWTMGAVADMVSVGVVPAQVTAWMRTPHSLERLHAHGQALAKVRFVDGLAWTVIDERAGDNSHGTRLKQSVHQSMLRLHQVKMTAVVYKAANGDWRASLRSTGRGHKDANINVHEIAQSLGGGGHVHAAGGIIGESPEQLITAIEAAFRSRT